MTYGWTIEQALDLTVPQINMLFRQMGKYPAPAAILGAVLNMTKGGDTDETVAKLAEHASVRDVAGGSKAFFESLGIEEEGG